MSESEFNRLRNTAVISSVAAGIGGAIIYLSPVPNLAKSLGSAIAIGSLGSLAATQLLVDSSEKISERISKSAESKENQLLKDKETAGTILKLKLSDIALKESEIASKAQYIETLIQKNNELQAYLVSLRSEVEDHKEAIKQMRSARSEVVVELLKESFLKIQNQVKGLLAHFGTQYPEIIGLQGIAIQYAEKVERFNCAIAAVTTFANPNDLMETGLALQHEIIHHTALLKMKAYKSVVDYLEGCLQNMVPIEYHQEAIAKVKEHYEKNYNPHSAPQFVALGYH